MENGMVRTILAKNLDTIMKANNLKPIDVAKKAGISDRMVSYILNKERSATIDVLESLAAGLKVTISSLLEDWTVDSPTSEHELTLVDKEHIQMLKLLNPKERKELENFARFLIFQRK